MTDPTNEPKLQESRGTDEPKPTPTPVLLDITDEEWIAASQSCCGHKE